MKHHFLFLVYSLAALAAGGQTPTVALIDKNDSLIIKKNLEMIIVSDDHIDGSASEQNLHYSENIDELIDLQNGISLTKRGNYASEAVNRGMASERMTVTLNGMKIFGACADKMDPVTSYVSANNLKSMEMGNGGDGKRFGSNVGGQLNLNTKEPILNDVKKFRSNLSIGGNTVSKGLQSALNANYSEKKWAVRINGMISKQDNYYAGGSTEIPYSQYNKANFGASIKFKLSEKDFILLDYVKDRAWDIGFPALPMDVALAEAEIYALTYKRFISGDWGGKLNAKVYGNNISHLMDDSKREVVMRMDMPGTSDTYGTYLMFEMNEKKHHQVTFIIDAYENRSLAEMTMFPEGEIEMYRMTWPDVRRRMTGIFLGDKYALKNQDVLSLTTRIDIGQSYVTSEFGRKQFEVFGYDLGAPVNQKATSLSVEYKKKINKENTISLDLSYSERLPSVSEQFAFYIYNSQDGFDYIGDPDIRNEEAFKAELLYKLKRDKVLFGISTFVYHMPNYIFGRIDEELSAMTRGAEGVKTYMNLKYANISGIEADITWFIVKSLTIKSAITYNYGTDNENSALPLMSPVKNITKLMYRQKKNFFDLRLVAAAKQLRVSNQAGENATPGYVLIDLKYSRKINFGKNELMVITGIENIFDTYYRDHIDWVDIPRPGRNFFLKFRLQL